MQTRSVLTASGRAWRRAPVRNQPRPFPTGAGAGFSPARPPGLTRNQPRPFPTGAGAGFSPARPPGLTRNQPRPFPTGARAGVLTRSHVQARSTMCPISPSPAALASHAQPFETSRARSRRAPGLVSHPPPLPGWLARAGPCLREAPLVDLDLTDEQRLISETAREFTDNEIAPRARDNDRAARFDTELARRLGDMGYLGSTVDGEYGGQSLDYVSYGLIVEQVGRGDSSARTVVSVQTSLVCGSIERWGSEEQKRRWLPRLCAGEAFGCFGLTEPDAGSDPSSMRTRAQKIDGGWRITGQKMWISLGNIADVALIFAQTNPEQRHRGIACFLVPTDVDGFTSQEIHGKLG